MILSVKNTMKSVTLKLAVIIFVFPFVQSIDITNAGEVVNFFTCLRNIFRRGVPLMFGPSDPFEMQSYSRKIEPKETGHWLSGLFDFKFIKFTGLSKFSIQSVAASHIKDENTFRFNTVMAFNLRLGCEYNATDGVFMDIAKFRGQGTLHARTSPVEVNLTLDFKENCTQFLKKDSFKNAHMEFEIKSIVNITGLEPNERMSSLVSRQLASMIDDLFNHHEALVEGVIDPLLNEFIKSLSLSNLPPIFRPIVELYFFFVWRSCITEYISLEDLLRKIWGG